MASTSALVSIQSVIWQECIDREICINVPLIGKKCVRIAGCVRLINENGTIFLEIEAFGQRWRYALTNACHDVFSWGIAKLRVCIQTIGGGVRIVLEGCIGVDGINKCWTLLAQDIKFFKIAELKENEPQILGLEPEWRAAMKAANSEIGALASPLSAADTEAVLSLRK
jgi:hypothetical protein